ncbi:MAG: polysaccharide deacetylase family protein [Rubrobacteridae bacterium]|nr:polysaccharide deacetylase family protein [Rubrobacteridae bacterium]
MRKEARYTVELSHDVDWPINDSRGLRRIAMATVGDIVKRKDPGLALKRLYSVPHIGSRAFDYDVNNTFDFIMDVSEKNGATSTFFMIANNSDGKIDGDYSLDEPWIKGLLKEFNERGHNIGLHLSYNSFRDKDRSRREFERLVSVCEGLKIEQPKWGSRQHFLRWENPTTWQNVADAGVAYDTTLTFADSPGFRCGVCYEYGVFNLRKREALTVKERPLIVMEGSLFDYLGLSYEDALEIVKDLSAKCRTFGGEFTLLWHNSSLITRQSKRWYKEIVNEIKRVA